MSEDEDLRQSLARAAAAKKKLQEGQTPPRKTTRGPQAMSEEQLRKNLERKLERFGQGEAKNLAPWVKIVFGMLLVCGILLAVQKGLV